MVDSTYRIILCDDEAALRQMLNDHLTECGYRVTEAKNAKQLIELLAEDEPDLIILDVRMPGTDGLSALKDIRQKSDVPIVMLTAASEVIDKVVALEFGADDYLVKPVDLRELQARINAAIRRKEFRIEQEEQHRRLSGTISLGPCNLDIDSAKLYGADGQEIIITAMEFSLLKVFVENRGRVLSREQLLNHAHEQGWEVYDRSIDLRISRVRRKIEPNPSKPVIIRTVHGLGYIFD